jgi:hypothetical protein
MTKKKIVTITTLFLLLVCGAASTLAVDPATNNWKKPLLDSLKARYEITTRDWLGKVKKPGTVLVVAQDGIQADEPSALMKPTLIKDGKITKSGGGEIVTGWGGRSLKHGEKVYVYDVRVHDEYVLLIIATVNTIDVVKRGKTKAVAQEASVSFRLDNIASPTFETVTALIQPWFVTEAEAASAKTVSLGQTIAEVEKALGQPTKIAKLEPKLIYYYTDMKVIFVDGKVTDVQ